MQEKEMYLQFCMYIPLDTIQQAIILNLKVTHSPEQLTIIASYYLEVAISTHFFFVHLGWFIPNMSNGLRAAKAFYKYLQLLNLSPQPSFIYYCCYNKESYITVTIL